jgi:ribosomal protein L16 Arg81 hydroxylase
MGASLVGDHIEDIDRNVRDAAAMLSEQFAGTAGANVYCSFKGIRAFNSHCDLHEVFAVQLEGEKVWQIYENRADSPVETIQGPNAQAIIDQAKGRVMMTVQMQPGDLLYIPRGYFHDALADTAASLHLTFGIAPLNGRYIFKLLEEMATRDPRFRAYLPDGRSEPAALRLHLAELADALGALVRSPLFETELTNRQRALVMRAEGVDLRKRE